MQQRQPRRGEQKRRAACCPGGLAGTGAGTGKCTPFWTEAALVLAPAGWWWRRRQNTINHSRRQLLAAARHAARGGIAAPGRTTNGVDLAGSVARVTGQARGIGCLASAQLTCTTFCSRAPATALASLVLSNSFCQNLVASARQRSAALTLPCEARRRWDRHPGAFGTHRPLARFGGGAWRVQSSKGGASSLEDCPDPALPRDPNFVRGVGIDLHVELWRALLKAPRSQRTCGRSSAARGRRTLVSTSQHSAA